MKLVESIFNIPGDSYYYIGGPYSISREYVRIPCQAIDSGLLSVNEVGLLVAYSGRIMVPSEYPAVDPLFVGIDLTQTKKSGPLKYIGFKCKGQFFTSTDSFPFRIQVSFLKIRDCLVGATFPYKTILLFPSFQ